MRRLAIIALFLVGCTGEAMPEIKYPDRLPVTEQAKEVTSLPSYQKPIEGGQAKGVSEGDEVPFDGILLTEDKAFASGHLRVSYDELYRTAETSQKAMIAIITIQEQQLYRGDQIIDQKEAQLRKIHNDWWQKNKLSVGIAIGAIMGIGVALLTGKVWAAIEEDQNGS